MATFVLVGGAWIGAWAWKEAAARLRAEGHLVYPLSLTGLGERVHLARPEVDLETHIADVVNLIESEDLTDVVLAGHSYAGIVVTGVADRIPERLAALVFVDSGPCAAGQAWVDLSPPEVRQALQRTVDEAGDGWRLPFPGVAALGEQASLAGLGPEERWRMEAKAAAQPWRTYTQPLRLHDRGEPSYRRAVVACDDMRSLIEAGIPELAAMRRPPWRYEDLATGHWPMLSAPADLAAVLARLAEEP